MPSSRPPLSKLSTNFPPSPSPPQTRRFCPALRAGSKARCGRPLRHSEHQWCRPCHRAKQQSHEQYKTADDRFVAALESSTFCRDVPTIRKCGSARKLREWRERLQAMLNMCLEVIRLREGHSVRFFGEADEGHAARGRKLDEYRCEIDFALETVNRRLDELETRTSGEGSIPRAIPDTQALVRDSARTARQALLDQLFEFRDWRCLHPDHKQWARFVDYRERLIIQALYAQARTNLATILNGPHASDVDLRDFLCDDHVTLHDLEQLCVAVALTPPRAVLHAIHDASRTQEDSHNVVCGRRIYLIRASSICLDAWDMFEDVYPDRGIAIDAAPSLTDWLLVDRIAALGLRFLNWRAPHIVNDSGTAPASIMFPLCDVFIVKQWEHLHHFIERKRKQEWTEKECAAALYLQFPKSSASFYQQVLTYLQQHRGFFAVVPLVPGSFTGDPTLPKDRLIPRLPTAVTFGRQRTAKSKSALAEAEWTLLPYLTPADLPALAGPSPADALHLLVVDTTNATLTSLRDNVANILLGVKARAASESDPILPTADAFLAAEMRILCNPQTAPALGLGQEGLVAIAAGTIQVSAPTTSTSTSANPTTADNKPFTDFKTRLTRILTQQADANLVQRWTGKRLPRKCVDAVRCWEREKSKLERGRCLNGQFALGTPEGRAKVELMTGAKIGCETNDDRKDYPKSIVKYVLEHAQACSETIATLLPSNRAGTKSKLAPWDGEIRYSEPQDIDCSFEFMRRELTADEANAAVRVVELDS
ncbi:hypothetical protein MKEN_00126000 [Mycena kentingensis (nom. inval.)]|nr:hypothetical protein MKEN_00126000 [Mycena kentingensis (nom. inval.)]